MLKKSFCTDCYFRSSCNGISGAPPCAPNISTWTNINDKLPPVGDCSENLLLLWIKCPDDIPYPEYYKGYEKGFYDGKIFFDDKYRYRIDNVEYWILLPESPKTYLPKE